MAILRLIPTLKSEDYEFLPSAGTVPQESADFIDFRKKFYHYQYEFISRVEDKSNIGDKILLYKKLATEDCDSSEYGMSNENDTYMKRYDIILTVDFKLSIQAALKLFEDSVANLKQQIVAMYEDYHAKNKFYLLKNVKDASGKDKPTKDLFERWEDALRIYDLHQNQEEMNISLIYDEMRWNKNKDQRHAVEDITLYLKYAIRLIEASSKDELYEEACKPMTLGKNRK